MRRLLALLSIVLWSFLDGGSSTVAAPREVDDILLTIKARQVLYLDKELHAYNIGVRVVDRVAVLFGLVPKSDLGPRAETKLRELFELRGVRNELRVLPSEPPTSTQRFPTPAPFPGQEPGLPATGARLELPIVPSERD